MARMVVTTRGSIEAVGVVEAAIATMVRTTMMKRSRTQKILQSVTTTRQPKRILPRLRRRLRPLRPCLRRH